MTQRGAAGPALTWQHGPIPLIVPLLPLIAIAALAFATGLNGDVQYALGGLHATEGEESFLTTFVHRPLAYRAALAAVDAPARAIGLGPEALRGYELAIRLLGLAASAAAAVSLWRGVRRWLPGVEAAVLGCAVGVALAVPPAWDFLQPDWMGGLFVALAVAAALWPRNVAMAGALSGLCVVMAVGVKLATISLAPLAILLVWPLSRRRALAAAAGGAAFGIAWLLGVALLLPIEWTWMRDMAALNPNSPLRSGIDARDWELLLTAIGSKVVLQPWLVVVPAATVLLVRLGDRAQRTGIVLAVGGALGLAVAPILLQGQFYLYHLAVPPVVAAAVWALGAARWWLRTGRLAWSVLAPPPVLGVLGSVLLAQPAATREALDVPVMAGSALLAVLLAAWAGVQPRQRRAGQPRRSVPGPWRATLIAAAVSAVVLPAVVPAAAWSLNPGSTPWGNGVWAERSEAKQAAYAALARQIGDATPVLYLAYGDVPYHLGNPTDCPYPSPLWLQRGMALGYVTDFASYTDNAGCLTSPTPRYLILQPSWFAFDNLQRPLRDLLEANYDCAPSSQVDDLLACPRRSP